MPCAGTDVRSCIVQFLAGMAGGNIYDQSSQVSSAHRYRWSTTYTVAETSKLIGIREDSQTW